MTEPLLRVENLTAEFVTDRGTIRAVDGVSFEVGAGEIVGLVGESGAGKSVVARCLLRLTEGPGRIVEGEIAFEGEPIVGVETGPAGDPVERDNVLPERAMRERIRGNGIALIFQEPLEALNPVLTVGEQLREVIELNRDLQGKAAKDEAVSMLREVGIPDPASRYEAYPNQFSGGMCQRVLIAMAIACEPSLVIADEPTTALDVTVERQILDLVTTLRETYETSFLWVTHDMGVVAELCDRVNVMYLGEIVEQAPVDELFYETKHPYTKALLDSVPRPDRTIEELDPIEGSMPEAIDPPAGCRFHPRCPDARAVCRRHRPQSRPIGESADGGHRVACLKHDGPDGGYESSQPLRTQDTDPLDSARAGADRGESDG